MMEDDKKKYMQYQILQQQVAMMLQEKSALEERITEMGLSREAVNSTKETDRKKSLWSPVGSGSFLKASLEDSKSMIVSIGANVFVEETKSRALEILEERREEASKVLAELEIQTEHYLGELQKLEEYLQNIKQ